MNAPIKPKILCVDDDINIVESIALILRKRYDVITTTSGLTALKIISNLKFLPVVISDMRMPNMDGATFLAKVKEISPHTTRMLLTGQTDLECAISAINLGQIFRFLVKPIPPTLLLQNVEAALAQHRLIISEKILLEQTLRGSIKVLTDLLSLSNPIAFGRAIRIKNIALELSHKLELNNGWQVEVAALLSHIGYITLPQTTAEKIYFGNDLEENELALVEKIPVLCDTLLSHIPRLEEIRSILLNHAKCFDGKGPPNNQLIGDKIPIGARILKIAFDFDDLETKGKNQGEIFEIMQNRLGVYDPGLLIIFRELRGDNRYTEIPRQISLSNLKIGMIFSENVCTTAGVLLIPRGQVVTDSVLERLRHFPGGNLSEEFPMFMPRKSIAEEASPMD